VSPNVTNTWEVCARNVGSSWDYSRYNNMIDVHKWISVNHSHITNFKAMIYSGDNDAICSTLGTQSWITPLFKDNVMNDW